MATKKKLTNGIVLEDDVLEKIYTSSLRFLNPLKLEDTYSLIVGEAMKLVGADSGAIYLEVDEEFQLVYSPNPSMHSFKPRKRGNTYRAFTTQTPIIAEISDIGKAHPQLRNRGLRSSIFIPLSYQNKTIGVLTVDTRRRNHFNQRTLEILTLFGAMVSLAIRKTQLYQETKEALDTRDLFISMASHELKTPLTSINGYIQLLQTRLNNPDSEEGRWLQQLSWESARLTNLVKELLEINRIRSGNLQYFWKECRLSDIVNRAINNFQIVHPKPEIVFEKEMTDGQDIIVGEYDKLLQVFHNLLDNAANYSPADKKIYVLLKKTRSCFIIEVKDQGIGIPKQDLPKVFERFHRGENNSTEGLGLGLFLVRDVIKQHHGSINIKSKVNKGTTVQLKLPARRI